MPELRGKKQLLEFCSSLGLYRSQHKCYAIFASGATDVLTKEHIAVACAGSHGACCLINLIASELNMAGRLRVYRKWISAYEGFECS